MQSCVGIYWCVCVPALGRDCDYDERVECTHTSRYFDTDADKIDVNEIKMP